MMSIVLAITEPDGLQFPVVLKDLGLLGVFVVALWFVLSRAGSVVKEVLHSESATRQAHADGMLTALKIHQEMAMETAKINKTTSETLEATSRSLHAAISETRELTRDLKDRRPKE